MGKVKKQKASKLTEKQKKVINIAVTVLQVTLIAISIVASIFIIMNPGGNTIKEKGISIMPVLSGSMSGSEKDSFNEGDLIFVRAPNEKKYNPHELEVGDIITFERTEQGQKIYVTHRIVEVEKLSGQSFVGYKTKGDANPINDIGSISSNSVLGIYSGKIAGVGKAITFLQKPTQFLLVILLPLALLFIYNIVIFVKMLMDQKVAKAKEMVAIDEEDEEEKKQRIIAEFLAAQQKESEIDDSSKENMPEDTPIE